MKPIDEDTLKQAVVLCVDLL